MDVTMPDGQVITGVPEGTTRSQLDMKMDTQFQSIVGKVLKFEGGYNDQPDDKGGATKFGISQKAYPNEDIKALTKDRAKELYYTDYYKRTNADKLSETKALLLFDAAVNHGVGGGSKLAQQTIGTKPDGVIGEKSLAALNGMDDKLFAEGFLDNRKALYDKIITRDSTQETFRKGWYNRITDLAKDIDVPNFSVETPQDTPQTTGQKLDDGIYQNDNGDIYRVTGSDITPFEDDQ